MEFRYITAELIHSEWDFVLKGLQKILDKTGDRWKPEDIYWLIKQGSMWTYVVFDNDGERAGIVLLQPTVGWDGKELFLFGGWNATNADVIDFSLNEILKAARSIGAKRLTTQSKRKGYERYAKRLGLTFSHAQYEREL